VVLNALCSREAEGAGCVFGLARAELLAAVRNPLPVVLVYGGGGGGLPHGVSINNAVSFAQKVDSSEVRDIEEHRAHKERKQKQREGNERKSKESESPRRRRHNKRRKTRRA
jgi:hypothetical protein